MYAHALYVCAYSLHGILLVIYLFQITLFTQKFIQHVLGLTRWRKNFHVRDDKQEGDITGRQKK